MFGDGLSVRAGVACALAGVTLAFGACGSDDDGDSAAQGAGGQSAAGEDGGDFVATGSDEQQIRQVLDAIQKDFDNGHGEAYCDKLVPAEQREIAVFGRNFGRGNTCVDVIDKVARQTAATDVTQEPTRFISAQVDGDRARARVSNGGRPKEWMAFRKLDGEWKIVESGFEPDPISAAGKQAEARKKSR